MAIPDFLVWSRLPGKPKAHGYNNWDLYYNPCGTLSPSFIYTIYTKNTYVYIEGERGGEKDHMNKVVFPPEHFRDPLHVLCLGRALPKMASASPKRKPVGEAIQMAVSINWGPLCGCPCNKSPDTPKSRKPLIHDASMLP